MNLVYKLKTNPFLYGTKIGVKCSFNKTFLRTLCYFFAVCSRNCLKLYLIHTEWVIYIAIYKKLNFKAFGAIIYLGKYLTISIACYHCIFLK